MKIKRKPKKTFYIKLIAVAIWVAIWQVAALIIDNPLTLTSPWQATTTLFINMGNGQFWLSVLGSFWTIACGFLLAMACGIALSVLSYKVKYVKEFLSPPMTVLNSVPVASFIVLLLISLKSKESLALIICFMMTLPVMYTNTLAGLNSMDKKMLEMACVFNVRKGKKLICLYTYKALPDFMTGSKIALGMCWKSGVAAELIGLVQNTIGNELYYAKLFLMMDSVFAWTVVIVVMSLLFEFLVLGSLRLFKRRLEK